jgi:hypothetical protein
MGTDKQIGASTSIEDATDRENRSDKLIRLYQRQDGKARTNEWQDLAATTGGTTEAGGNRGGDSSVSKLWIWLKLPETATQWKHSQLLEAT